MPLPDEIYRRLVESAPDAMVIVDADGRILLVNRQAEALFGYDRDEMVGAPVELLVPDRLRPVHSGHRATFVVDARTRPMGAGLSLFGKRKDGSEFPVEISLSPLETDGRVMVSAAIRDATERERTAEAVRSALEHEQEAAERLRALDRMKDTFLHAVSHELRNPLAVVVGFADTLVEHRAALDDEQVDRMIRGISTNAARLNQLLTDLLDLDRLTSGVIRPERADVDLDALARRAVDGIDLGGHVLAIDAEGSGRVDAGKLERIVENLVTNAARYSPGAEPIEVKVARAHGAITIEVADRGPGVPDHLKSAIFNAFDRGETPKSIPGTGIGLSIVARFAEMHGGRAWVEDRPGGGAVFKVVLPEAGPP